MNVNTDELFEFIGRLERVLVHRQDGLEEVALDTAANRVISQSFAKSALATALYVVNASPTRGALTCTLASDLSGLELDPLTTSVTALIKSSEPLDLTRPVDTQLHVLNIPVASTTNNSATSDEADLATAQAGAAAGMQFEALRSLLNLAIAPYFERIAAAQPSDAAAGARKIFNKLLLTLQHLQQKIHTPDLLSLVHPLVEALSNTPGEADLAELVNDTSILNELTSIVNGWVRQCQTITTLEHTPSDGLSVVDEMLFWRSMEESLAALQRQVASQPVKNTIEILRRAKRFHVVMNFTNGTGLEEKMAQATVNNSLVKDLPLDELLSSDITSLKHAVVSMSNLIKTSLKKFHLYPLPRAVELCQVIINQDITPKFIECLQPSAQLMAMPIDHFLVHYHEYIVEVFKCVDVNVKAIVNLIRELMRKRLEKFFVIKLNQHALQDWQSRLHSLYEFRIRHDGLLKSCLLLHEPDDRLIEAYNQYIITCDVFAMTVSGTNVWKSNVAYYDAVYDSIRFQVVSKVNALFDACTSFDDFVATYRQLLGGNLDPSNSILSLINEEHKHRCMEVVKEEITQLTNLHKKQTSGMIECIRQSHPCHNAGDGVAITDRVIWLISVNQRLDYYVDSLGQLFGDGWDQYTAGSKVASEAKRLRTATSPQAAVREWTEAVQLSFNIEGLVFLDKTSAEFDFVVNFDPHDIATLNQLTILSDLGFHIPLPLNQQMRVASRLLPLVKDLYEHTNILKDIYQFTKVDRFAFLIKDELLGLSAVVGDCLSVDWINVAQALDLQEADDLKDRDFSNLKESKALAALTSYLDRVYTLYCSANAVKEFVSAFNEKLLDLETCRYEAADMSRHLEDISDLADRFGDKSSANLELLYDLINADVEATLTKKCIIQLQMFCEHVANGGGDTTTVSLLFQDQTFTFSPSMETCRQTWVSTIEKMIATATNNYLINYSNEKMFLGIVDKISHQLQACFAGIDKVVDAANKYLGRWSHVQELWETSPAELASGFAQGDGMRGWIEALEDVRMSRSTFDTKHSVKHIGGQSASFLKIDFTTTQARISARFDDWQEGVLTKFAEAMVSEVKKLDQTFADIIHKLEPDADFGSTSDIIALINDTVHGAVMLEGEWKTLASTFARGQVILAKLRFKFPTGWLFVEQIENHLSEIATLVQRKTLTITQHLDLIHPRIKSEQNRLNDAIRQLHKSWSAERPVSGDLQPVHAIKVLHRFEKIVQRISDEVLSLIDACRSPLLDMQVAISENIDEISAEIAALLKVWRSLDGIWANISTLKATAWEAASPRKVRRQLDDLLDHTRSLPTTTRQYAAFASVEKFLKSCIRNHSTIIDLKNGSMRPRHWKQLFQKLSTFKVPDLDTLTLGQVWEFDLLANEQLVKATLNQALAEQTLEETLQEINFAWDTITFETFNYKQNKLRLVKGWEKVIDQCTKDLGSLANMRNSSFYFNFEQEATTLGNKISSLFHILDVWVDVQREWVYLDGVFGNSEIPKVLPLEYTRFNNLSHEFFAIVQNTLKLPRVIDVVSMPNLSKTLAKTLESLSKVRRSLGEFLENQRGDFPRFYFLGNEDLLEIIGCGNDGNGVTSSLNQHISKMFTGIKSVNFSAESCLITGVNGDYDEHIELGTPVSLIKFPRLIDWLQKLEVEIKFTMSMLIESAINSLSTEDFSISEFVNDFPSQCINVAFQVEFAKQTRPSLHDPQPVLDKLLKLLKDLTDAVCRDDLSLLQRKKYQNLIIEILHQRDVLVELTQSAELKEHLWSLQQLYNFDESILDPLARVVISQANVEFVYGYEYLGVSEKLAYTPLTNRCFLSMSQALAQNLGGSPFGPAGTGKTETIKALGHNLGKMVLVFNCDESFDFPSMARIFIGLCKVGCWGCFDEFNRLDGNILSAVATQIESIGLSLGTSSREIDLFDNHFTVHRGTGIFITMNPGYAGRSELPENLKVLFRSISMNKPDMEIIVDVVLTSNGFARAKQIAGIVVSFFTEIQSRTSDQIHYDFGLRALKSTLVRCGHTKRQMRAQSGDHELLAVESEIVLRSIRETVSPKLIAEDEAIMNDLLTKHFPGVSWEEGESALAQRLEEHARSKGLTMNPNWLTKALQFYRIQSSHHGIMLVGEAGSGKTTIWRLVLDVLTTDVSESIAYVIDCKVMLKDDIYGTLDPVTREWEDGLFTGLLRKVISNLRGELSKRIWVVFDGDIDPEWAENLNSVLDDNKILTLPNGERLFLPDNVKLIFEVDSLRSTTPATVSRCGMVWFDELLVPLSALYLHLLYRFAHARSEGHGLVSKRAAAEYIGDKLSSDIVLEIIDAARLISHVMKFSTSRSLETLMTLMSTSHAAYLNKASEEGPLSDWNIYLSKCLMLNLIWAFSGDCLIEERERFGVFVAQLRCFDNVDKLHDSHYLDYKVTTSDGSWCSWLEEINAISLEPHQISDANTVVPTLDTIRHEHLIYSMLQEHRPFLLCGPPGSGKTMILLEALRKSPDLDILSLNFSKDTTPDLLMRSLHQLCEYENSSSGLTLAPKISGKWVVVFCDEINLPSYDNYGTQRVLSLLRQMIEQGGFWRHQDKQWVSLTNIQFVGACNPPTDPGRHELPDRLLRHFSLIMVDYPGAVSLQQIYQTYNLAVMKCAPNMRGFTQAITLALIEVYKRTKAELTHTMQQHYIYSPRELTRWSKGLLEAMKSHDYSDDLTGLVRLWYHEGLRLFYDRLVSAFERDWTIELFGQVINEFFPHINVKAVMQGPVLFSNWLSSDYEQVSRQDLLAFVKERLRVFSEEEIDADLVLYDDMLDQILRIDRVLRQPQGHMIMVGHSTSGKTTLTRFVAWINGLKVFQLSVHLGYNIGDFDSTLRSILLRCARGEKVCFMIDESSVLETSFIERMNTLLANAEIPGLFEDDNLQSLMKLCQTELQRGGLFLDTKDELYKWFTGQVANNLHVVFTISDTHHDNRPKITTSPALFNRCVLSWTGDWSVDSMRDIAHLLVASVPLDVSDYVVPPNFEKAVSSHEVHDLRDVIVDTLIYTHKSLKATLPSHFLQLIATFVSAFHGNLSKLEENQRHVNNGLDKLKETVLQVNEMRSKLSEKSAVLAQKDQEAKVMLNKMLTDQNEAERKQEFSIETQKEIARQQREIESRREEVLKDLELAEPAVLEAQRGVQNIKKQHLTEIRSMSNPPNAVKITMESVCCLIGYEVNSWRDVQLIVRKDDFIASIVSFDNERQVTPDLRAYMEHVYLSRDDFTFEVVDRASKACGPLLQWVRAQLSYLSVLENVEPLRQEMLVLESSTQKTQAQLIAINDMIHELENKIDTYKEEYSCLIRDAENVKTDMRSVSLKIDRSMRLIESLTSERQRWAASIRKFHSERQLLIGNSLLVSSFQTYCGQLDERERERMMASWMSRLRSCGVAFDPSIRVVSYLIGDPEVLALEEVVSSTKDLGADESNFANLALIKVSPIPFIIDPSASTIEILSSLVVKATKGAKKLIVTSFTSPDFIHKLENALRFGGHLLILGAELYDPVLNTVLRGEIYKNGGRRLVKIQDQEIDYSADFKLYLLTKDPSVNIPPFVRGRTQIVNFSVTNASVENLILNLTLSQRSPEMEAKRRELLSLQGHYKSKLHSLEVELLSSLGGGGSGGILEDDSVLGTLETLKTESHLVDEKLGEASAIMQSVDDLRNAYDTVARHASQVYTVLKLLRHLSKLYDFSLELLNDIYRAVLEDNNLEPREMVCAFYQETFARVSPSLKGKDKVVFALCLFLGYNVLETSEHFKKSMVAILVGIARAAPFVHELLLINEVEDSGLLTALDICQNPSNPTLESLSRLLQPGQLEHNFAQTCSFLFNNGNYQSKYDLGSIIEFSGVQHPVILATPDGFDPTFNVQQLAGKRHVGVVAMGTKEGIELANKEIKHAQNVGSWVVVQNVQLAPEWLGSLSDALSSTSAHGFRVFLSCDVASKVIPATLVHQSTVIVLENRLSMQNRVSELYEAIPRAIIAANPGERKHLYFLLIWFHCMVMERLQYVPIGFHNRYDFSVADFKAACYVVEKQMLAFGKRSNVAPGAIPWETIRYMISEITYGGKVNDDDDLQYLVALSHRLFQPAAFDLGFELVTGLSVPEGRQNVAEYLEWATQLPEQAPLLWIDLEEGVDDTVRENTCREIAAEVVALAESY